MQHEPPKFAMRPATGLAIGLSDSSKTRQVILKVPSTVDSSIALTVLTMTARKKNGKKRQHQFLVFCWKKDI